MPVSVNQVQHHEAKDPLDTIMKGLQIAQGIYNIKDAGVKADQLRAQTELQQKQAEQQSALTQKQISSLDRQERGVLTAPEYFSKAGTIQEVPVGTAGSTNMTVMRNGNEEQVAYQPLKLPNAEANDLKSKLAEARLSQMTAKRIPGNEAMIFGQGESASKALGSLNGQLDTAYNNGNAGPVQGNISKLTSLFGVTSGGKEAQKIQALRDTTALEIASYLKGGSPTKDEVDMVKNHALPQITDASDVRQDKTNNLQMLIDMRRKSQQDLLGQAGYDVSNFSTPIGQKTAAPRAGTNLLENLNPNSKANAATGEKPLSFEEWKKQNGRK